jgi:hypothetical protein
MMMKKLAGFHSLVARLLPEGSLLPRLRRNLGTTELHIEGDAIFGRLSEEERRRICCQFARWIV